MSLSWFWRLHPVARSLLLVVGIPTLAAVIYYGLVASDRYVTEFRFAIQTSSPVPTDGMLSAVLGGGIGGAAQDAVVVQDYITSRDMLEALDARLNLRAHYTSPDIDWFSRLKKDASVEDFLEYWHDRVRVERDTSSNIIKVDVQAFSPEMAKQIGEVMLEFSEQLVNRMSERIAKDTVRFTEQELEGAAGKVRTATAALTEFRNTRQTLDPDKKSGAVMEIVATLEGELADTRAKLSEAMGYMREDSTQVVALKNRARALEKQIGAESNRLTGADQVRLSALMEEYEGLMLERELAQQRYSSALAALEAAQAEASRQQRYLAAFVRPALPQESMEPRRLWSIFTVMIGAFLIYGIGALMFSAIKDHMGRY